MENLKQEDLIETVPTSETATEEVAEETTTQDPLKTELDKVKVSSGKTELEKAEFSLKSNAKRLRELGGDPDAILGRKIDTRDDEEDDSKPVTRKELKDIISAGATKTALQLADEIPDNTERELVKHYLENRIQPSGNPQEDFRDARRIANSVKNEHIVEEIARKTPPKTHSNASGVPAKTVKPEAELTEQELQFTKAPFNMTKDAIIKARQG